jgi:transposase
MEAVLFVLLTRIPWRALPRSFGAATTTHHRFQEWCAAGALEELWRHALVEYDDTLELR